MGRQTGPLTAGEHQVREFVFQEQNMTKPKAVILTSGGLDSTTVLAMAVREGFECYTLSFDYGQRHKVELAAAQECAEAYGSREHKVVTDRKSTRLNSSHVAISYAVFCLKK